MKKRLYILVEALLLGAVFFFIGKVIVGNWQLIKDHSWEVDTALLSLSTLLLIGSLVFLIITWNVLLRALDMKLPLMRSAKIWSLSHLGRYLPGYIWQFVGRIAFLTEEGFSKKRGILSSYIESGIAVLTGIVMSLVAMVFAKNRYDGLSLPLFIILILICIIMLHPKVLELALNTFFTLIKKEKVKVDYSFGRIMVVAGCFMVYWLIYSAAFFVFIKSVYPIESTHFFDISFALTASWVIGFLTIFAPAGIGVREGLLILFLGLALPEFIAPVISIAARLWLIFAELFCFITIIFAHKIFDKGENTKVPDAE